MTLIKTNVRYTVDDATLTIDDAIRLYDYEWGCSFYDWTDEWEVEAAARECAKDFLENHGGWEYKSWTQDGETLRFYIWKDETTKIAVDVECEYEPCFRTSVVD